MSTKNSFILALIRRVSLSIAVIGLAIACRSKADSSGDNRESAIKTKEQRGGKVTDDNKEDYEDVLDYDDENPPSYQDIDSGVKGDVHKVDIKKEKDPITKQTKTTVTVSSPEKKTEEVTPTGADESESTPEEVTENKETEAESSGEEDEDETQEDSSEVSSTEFGYDGSCKSYSKWKFWRWCFNKRHGICNFPSDYERSTVRPKTDCCRKLVRINRKITRKSIKRPRSAQKTAFLVGATSNITSSTSCKIRNVGVSYYKYRYRLFRQWCGIRRKGRKKCCECESITPCRKDRIALVSFHRDGGWRNALKRSSIKWDDPCEAKLCKLSDLFADKKDGCNDGYPKVGLELVAKITYTYDKDKKEDCEKEYTYRIKGKHKCLLDDVLCGAKKFTRKHRGKTYTIHEKCLKRGEYTGEYHAPCSKWCGRFGFLGAKRISKMINSRHALMFFFPDNDCAPCEKDCNSGCESDKEEAKEENNDCSGKTWDQVHCMRRKGNNALTYLWGLINRPNWKKSSRRLIEIEKVDCKGCVVTECLAIVDFVWKFTVKKDEKDEEPEVYEIEHNYNFT